MIGTITSNGSGIGRLGIHDFELSGIPLGATINSVRITNFVVSNQGYLSEPNSITVGFYANATVTPASALAVEEFQLINGPTRSDYAADCPVLTSATRTLLQNPNFGIIVELDERGAVLIFSLDLIIEFTVDNTLQRNQYRLDVVPDLPEELHEVLAMLMAIKASAPMATDEAAWARLMDMKKDVGEILSNVETENAEVNSPFKTTTHLRRKYLNMTDGTVY